MIVITGAAGFIGSCMVRHLNRQGRSDLILVDHFQSPVKQHNLAGCTYRHALDRGDFLHWLQAYTGPLEAVLHLGARTDTAETDWILFERLNVQYTQALFRYCTQQQCPFIYASSAATYGLGEHGYSDSTPPEQLHPLNAYGRSKNVVDRWILEQEQAPPFWAGLKFFNVYGPNEYHKGRMASVIFHAFRQIQATGTMRLFRSHHPTIQDGQQQRDFIYVADLLHIIDFLRQTHPLSGLYNVGTGQARSFYDLTRLTFEALDMPLDIQYIDTPLDIRSTYQYYTQADLSSLRRAGYERPFCSLEDGVMGYVQNFLLRDGYY